MIITKYMNVKTILNLLVAKKQKIHLQVLQLRIYNVPLCTVLDAINFYNPIVDPINYCCSANNVFSEFSIYCCKMSVLI